MIATDAELYAVLRQFNPWWSGSRFPELPAWRRAAFAEIAAWAKNPPGGRALLLSGARQVGKTTLFLQAIDDLLSRGTPAQNILYATFDHPLLKLVGLETVLRLWAEHEPPAEGIQYLFLDEIQVVKDWQTWLKIQVDFTKHRRIAVTGSAAPLLREGQKSGVGRWHTIRLATLSFYEYLNIRKAETPEPAEIGSLARLFDWSPRQFVKAAEDARPLVPLFNEYLLRGGFPQVALADSIVTGQRPDNGFKYFEPGDIRIETSLGTYGIEVGGGKGGKGGSAISDGASGSTYKMNSNGDVTDHYTASSRQVAGSIWADLDWLADPIAPYGPVQFKIDGDSTLVGQADYVFTRNSYTTQHAVIELAFDLDVLEGAMIQSVHWRPTCGNDELNVQFDAVPEPTTIAFLALGSVAFLRRTRHA